jgi:hypothetical protein
MKVELTVEEAIIVAATALIATIRGCPVTEAYKTVSEAAHIMKLPKP